MAHELDLESGKIYNLKKHLIIDKGFIRKHYQGGMLFSSFKSFCEIAEMARDINSSTHLVGYEIFVFNPPLQSKEIVKQKLLQGVASSAFIDQDFPSFKKFLKGKSITQSVELSVVTDNSLIKCDETSIRQAVDYLFDLFMFPQTFLDTYINVNIRKETLEIDIPQNLTNELLKETSYNFIAKFNVEIALEQPFKISPPNTYRKPLKINYDENYFQILGDLILNKNNLQFDTQKGTISSKAKSFDEANKFFLERAFKGETFGVTRVGQLLHEFGNAEQSQKTKIFKNFKTGKKTSFQCGGNTAIDLKLDHSLNAEDSHEQIQKLIELLSRLKEAVEAVDEILIDKGKTPARIFMAQKVMNKIQMDPISFCNHADHNIADYARLLLNSEN